MKIALLHGAIKNAGDFLIKKQTNILLKYCFPDCSIDEYYRNKNIEQDLPEINTHDIVIFAGGPLYYNGFYPYLAPLVDNLSKIKIPIMMLGAGWWDLSTNVNILYNYKFSEAMNSLLSRAISDTKLLGCRDFATVNVLRNNGFDNIIMTGCPAWYNLDNIGITRYTGVELSKCKTICISDCGNIENYPIAIELMRFIKHFFYNSKIYFVCHRGLANLDLDKFITENNIQYINIAGNDTGFQIYDKCDLHIGFRVHAHIYNLSKRKLSILIEEDSRGSSLNETLGLPSICTSLPSIENGKTKFYTNDKILYQVEDYILNLASNNYNTLENSYRLMNQYFGKMKKHILSINDII